MLPLSDSHGASLIARVCRHVARYLAAQHTRLTRRVTDRPCLSTRCSLPRSTASLTHTVRHQSPVSVDTLLATWKLCISDSPGASPIARVCRHVARYLVAQHTWLTRCVTARRCLSTRCSLPRSSAHSTYSASHRSPVSVDTSLATSLLCISDSHGASLPKP